FSSFIGNGEDGLHLAWRNDGLDWEKINNGKPIIPPLVGESCLMRDPCITTGPDGTFHMVWTTSWAGNTIGYAHSEDLINWSRQITIPVMEHEDSVRNCWAPEINYNPKEDNFFIYWSSTIMDKFPETANSTKNGKQRNHRIYFTTTSDFKSFSETKLFYEPGFNVIDASIKRNGDKYIMFIKNETELPDPEKNISVVFSDQITGPYSLPQKVITGDYWAEGPTAIQIDGKWHVYFDKYRKHEFGLLTSSDLVQWRDESAKLKLPAGIRHGTIFEVSQNIFEKLNAAQLKSPMLYRDISRKGRPYSKDPTVIYFKNKYYMYYSIPPGNKKDQNGWHIGIAVSTDLDNWEKLGEILPEGPYEKKGLCAPEAEVIDGRIHLFYQTYGNGLKDAICHAVSSDGLNFNRNDTNPIFSPTGDWNVGRAIDADVLIDGDSAYLYWATRDMDYKQQMLGVSVASLSDGFKRNSWKQLSKEPLLKPEHPWEMNCVEAASVFKENGRYYMFYAGAYNHEGQQ
ncbi:MAG: family 43 glycosylhydrolase, partial [Cyclobacteriaceae bacterium]|nr:family 43 glycosylhydrolase [Cyclobacteriaceae bacterium]